MAEVFLDAEAVAVVAEDFRRKAEGYKNKLMLSSAIFWAGQAACLSRGDPEDLLRQAELLILDRQYHRAANLLLANRLESASLRGCYLAARASLEAGDLEQAVAVMDTAAPLIEKARLELDPAPPDGRVGHPDGGGQQDSVESQLRQSLGSVFLLRGRILEEQDNKAMAAESFKEALKVDVFCREAFSALVQHQFLLPAEEAQLLREAPIREQCGVGTSGEAEARLVGFLYRMSLNKYSRPSDLEDAPPALETGLGVGGRNSDLLVARAERHFYNCDYAECFAISTGVLKQDPYHVECLPIHVSCLVELRKSSELFRLAHKLIDLYPESALAWFAVGCYYYLVSKHDFARRYLSKATQLDRTFGPAWMAYGHSFALESEHDQAMAAYFKAFQLMRGCHLPLLYIGVEYVLTNNPKLANNFFAKALEMSEDDPFVLHEWGVNLYQDRSYERAEEHFRRALAQLRRVKGSVLPAKWEPLLNNLGHTCRKLGKYTESLDFHKEALVLAPLSASTYSAIGYVQSLCGDLADAVESFHKALSLRRDDTFSTTMLNYVIDQLMHDTPPFQGFPEELPKLDPVQARFAGTAQKNATLSVAEGASSSSRLQKKSFSIQDASHDVEMSDTSDMKVEDE